MKRFCSPKVELLEDRCVPAISVANISYSVLHDQSLIGTVDDSSGAYGVIHFATDTNGAAMHVTAVNGAAMMLKCPFCHYDNEEGALFCEQCKSDLSGIEPTSTIGQPVTLPSGASLTIDDDGSFLYAPAAHQAYTDTFTATISDGTDSVTAPVTIDVTDQAPVAPVIAQTVMAGTPNVTGNVLAAASDADGDAVHVSALMIKCPFCGFENEDGALFCEQCKSDLAGVAPTSVIGQPITLSSGATFTLYADGSYLYTPVSRIAAYTDTFTYTISDGVETSTGTVTINVLPDPVDGLAVT
jgi:hypothetical protein